MQKFGVEVSPRTLGVRERHAKYVAFKRSIFYMQFCLLSNIIKQTLQCNTVNSRVRLTSLMVIAY
jgi:hypothetical protein